MASEIVIFLQTLLQVSSSLCFCFSIRNSIPNGFLKLLLILPFFLLFLYIPLQFQTINLRGILGLFIGWLGSFKLLLFAFGKGPLCSAPAASSFPRFLAIATLPIEIPDQKPATNASNPSPVLQLSFKSKLGLLIFIFTAINYKNFFHPNVTLIFFCFLIYLFLEIILDSAAAVAKATLRVELLPHFEEPYLSSSLQDFWGRRWNLMVSRILRLSVYDPCRKLATGYVGRETARVMSMMAAFVVSGLMHELIYYYMGRMAPTWEVTWFFVVHGFCLAVETVVKKAMGGRFRPSRMVAAPVTIGFVMVTGSCLFFPQFFKIKAAERMLEEYVALGTLVKNLTLHLIAMLNFI